MRQIRGGENLKIELEALKIGLLTFSSKYGIIEV